MLDKLSLSQITNSSVLISNKIRLAIIRGDITTCQEDTMVHFTDQYVSLSCDPVSARLAEKGGQQFQAACDDLDVLEPGSVEGVNGFRLNCREVFNCNCPPYSNEKESRRAYHNIVRKCLVKTAAARCKSMSIPAGGNNPQGYEARDVITWILEAVHDHCDMHRRSSVRSVTVVIASNDSHTQQGFDGVMYSLMPSRIVEKHLTEITQTGMIICDRVKLSVVVDDITKSKDEAVVNSVARQMDLTRGKVAPALAQRAGPQLQKACTKVAPLEVGDIVETDGFNMGCKIMHCNIPEYVDESTNKPKLKSIVRSCLTKAATSQYTSLGFPALGTGSLKYPAELVAQWMVESVIDHCDLFTRSSLTNVNIYLHDEDDDTQEGFNDYMESLAYKEVTDEHLLIYNRIHLDLVWKELDSSIEDTVVVSADGSDPATIAVLTRAEDDCKRVRASLSPGNVGESGAYAMPCKQILHYSIGSWNDDEDGEILEKIVKCCLVKAALNNHRSIAFPAMGMFDEEYPDELVCQSMVNAVEEYCEETPHSSLMTVKLYLPPEHTSVSERESFKWSLRALGCKRQDGALLLANGTKFSVIKGDLADTEVDTIVNSTGSHMSLSGGKISLALLNKAGKALQEECDKHAPILNGEIVMTGGFGLPCKNVLHVCCPKYWRAGESEQILRNLITRCLTWADDTKEEDDFSQTQKPTRSIALPAVGTGLLKYPPQSVARCMVHAVADFARLNRKSALKEISLVLYHNDTETADEVEEALGLDSQESTTPRETTKKLEDGKLVIDLPGPWEKPVNEYREFVVNKKTKEWDDLVADFQKTINRRGCTVIEAKRVQNPQTYRLFDVMKKSVARKLNKPEQEVETAPLWHGTAEESVGKITHGKFDRVQAGDKNRLGKGTYFSISAYYSSHKQFSPANSAGERFMILARVITGAYCQGQNTLSSCPYKSKYEQYDSVVDDVANPTMYAVFHDAAAYPEYVIRYKY